jgi:beta-aspartyl-peptidase (threonine type)
MLGEIAVHGGAGLWQQNLKRGLRGVSSSASVGAEILRRGGSALDAVEAAVCALEDDPVFNAGRGSSLTMEGTVEMDAAIMDGKCLSAGAVALVRSVKNPVHLARLVMEKTDHVLLAGEHAERLGRLFSLPRINPITPHRRKIFNELRNGKSKARVGWWKRTSILLREHPEVISSDTVGAVARDSSRNFAVAASTGGVVLKLPGRIGDTPLIGCGLYSDNRSGAATVTGTGEVAVRLVLSKTICSLMERGLSAPRAAAVGVQDASKRLMGNAGVIAIDRIGRIAAVHNTPMMPWAYSTAKMRKPQASLHGKIVARLS